MKAGLAAVMGLVGACALAAEGEEPPRPTVDVIPQPKEVFAAQGVFRVDRFCIVLVSEQATRGTRRAARAVQLSLRARFGMDVPIVRIAEQMHHGVTRPIWVVEPRLRRPPAKTIGVRGLKLTDEMKPGGYFIRVDAVEAVLHGADDAGSYHAAQTFLQLIRPPRKGSLFRSARPPSVPCLWIKDWPSQPVRAITVSGDVATVPAALPTVVERLVELGAHYKLNALPKSLLPGDPDLAARLRELAAWRGIAIVDKAPPLSTSPLSVLTADPRQWLAARAEAAWGPPDPDTETFRRRLARDVAAHPTPQPAPPPPPRPDLLADDEDETPERDDKEDGP